MAARLYTARTLEYRAQTRSNQKSRQHWCGDHRPRDRECLPLMVVVVLDAFVATICSRNTGYACAVNSKSGDVEPPTSLGKQMLKEVSLEVRMSLTESQYKQSYLVNRR